MKLYEVPRNSRIKVIDDGAEYNFRSIDGMYSYCRCCNCSRYTDRAAVVIIVVFVLGILGMLYGMYKLLSGVM